MAQAVLEMDFSLLLNLDQSPPTLCACVHVGASVYMCMLETRGQHQVSFFIVPQLTWFFLGGGQGFSGSLVVLELTL